MALFNLHNEVPSTLQHKEFALIKEGEGFRLYVGDSNNVPVPAVGISQAELEAYTPPLQVVSRSYHEGLGDTSGDSTVYLIYEDEDEDAV